MTETALRSDVPGFTPPSWAVDRCYHCRNYTPQRVCATCGDCREWCCRCPKAKP